ncbi:HNH endonuclease family protein [Poritiphilus flavus]|uniref:TIGR02646 family protein n=1 Tax=Poritiphilus flavus TaxID=2697053 RepID=A0A6L9EI32_9FLAO|nr:hypothetical protein [Poritiphilus flavus]NAS14343.1 hypothetical protein [Poritiphilus flavus]
MIRINVSWPDSQEWRNWRQDCEQAKREIEEQVQRGEKPKVKNLYKREGIKERYYKARDGLFNGKCAYCEVFVSDFMRGDIEHFRPKLKVTDENDVPIKVDYGNGPEDHKGYYWLSYDCSNLLLSCQLCNQAKKEKEQKIGKHNRFPVEGEYAVNQAGIDKEYPLLINPLVEDPSKHIMLELKDDEGLRGFLFPLDKDKKGEMTINVLALNIREQLVEKRQGKIDQFYTIYCKCVTADNQASRDKYLKKLREMLYGKGEHSFVAREVWRDINSNNSTLDHLSL